MATVKLASSGNVIVIDGKVSCTCCPAPPECCMYPAGGLVDESITYDDLPVGVTLIPDGYSPIPMDKAATITGLSIITGGYTSSDGHWCIAVVADTWTVFYSGIGDGSDWESGGQYSGECLITGDGNYVAGDDAVEDAFLGSYLIKGGLTWTPVTGDEVVRTELCGWSVNFTGDEYCAECSILLSYDGSSGTPDYKWHLTINTLAGGGSLSFAVKTSPDQSSPVGTYYDEDNDATYTVEEP